MVPRSASAARVRDLSGSTVETIDANSTVEAAAIRLCDLGVSFAPVIDELGRCIGVISAFDIMRFVADRKRACEEGSLELMEHVVEQVSAEDSLSIEMRQSDLVRNYMTKGVQTIGADATISAAAQIMSEEHIHHLLVLDDCNRPVSVININDLIACFLRSGESSTK